VDAICRRPQGHLNFDDLAHLFLDFDEVLDPGMESRAKVIGALELEIGDE
jgi:hypothetical protein